MAVTGKSIGLTLTTSSTDLYTCPSATTAYVKLLQASNVTAGSVSADVNINFFDSSASLTESLARSVAVLPKESISCLTGILILEPGDKIQGSASANSSVDVVLSLMEVT